jgi:hypothetical protein
MEATSIAKLKSKTRLPAFGPLSASSRRSAASLQSLLRELAFVLLSQGITPTTFTELSRAAFVHAAAKWSKLQNGRVNYSRVAAQTGLTRAAVRRLLSSQTDWAQFYPKQTAVERVIDGWLSDPAFLSAGKPKPLAVDGPRTSFRSLALRYGGDIPPKAVLAELQRVDAARIHRSQVHLRPAPWLRKGLSPRFLSTGVPMLVDGLKILGDMEDRKPDAEPIQRLVLAVHSDLDLAFVRERCVTTVRSMLEGLGLSLRTRAAVSGRRSKGAKAFAVTVLLSETQAKKRQLFVNRHGGGSAHGKNAKATPR